MSSRRLVFVLPDASDLVTGGNIYNRELVDAARRHRAIEAVSVADWERHVAAGEPGTYFVDTLNMRELLRAVPAPPEARRAGRQRFVLVVHLLPSMDPARAAGDPALAVEEAAVPRFDGFLVTSAYTAGVLRARGLTQPCLVVPPGLPHRPRPPLAYRPGARALLVGNLVANKGVLPFIHALAAALPRAGGRGAAPTVPLTIDVVGRADLDPDHAAACLRAARAAGLTGEADGDGGGGGRAEGHGEAEGGPAIIRFRGPTAYDDMDRHYRDASLLLSPSLMETFGMALQEARAFGLPILACRVGNTAAHIEEGVTGHLYDSAADLVNGLLELVRSPDRLRALFMSAQAARAGGDYTWDAAAREFLRQQGDLEAAAAGPGATR
ncbi:MAG TPA: glycosyltransferase family 4 protein [Kofleriaceae bacterium]|nr:glycosyltransferase family 4 protein [Kofleriaceae bacterium]